MSREPPHGSDDITSLEQTDGSRGEKVTASCGDTAQSHPAGDDRADTHAGARRNNGKFRKGTSGNSKGRPPKPKEEFDEVVWRIFDERVPGQYGSITVFEALARSAIVHAMKDPRLSLSLLKTVLMTFGSRKSAETQEHDEQGLAVLANFRQRERKRLEIEAANDRGTPNELGSSSEIDQDPSEVDASNAERSA